MLNMEDLVPEMFDKNPDQVIRAPVPRRRVEEDAKPSHAAVWAAGRLIAGWIMIWSGISGVLSIWIGPGAWWLLALGIGIGLTASNGLALLRALLLGGLVTFPLKHWGTERPSER